MRSPFIYGKVVSGKSFINRTSEISKLSGNFQNHINTTLISPRRWGKSSLVKKTVTQIQEKKSDLLFCFMDLFRIRTEEEFYKHYAAQVVKSTSGKLDDWVRNVKNFAGRLSPSISFGADPVTDFQISFGLSDENLDKEEILNLPERIAAKRKKHIVVCIDEFQNIAAFPKHLDFQKLLRSVWQYHKHVSYCIYGSKKHMMMDIFQNQSMPFYNFGDVFFLQKIEKHHFVKYISDSFAKTNKSIDEGFCEKIVDNVEAHPYFVQQLAHIVWTNTRKKTSKELFYYSIDELLDQNSILYYEITQSLSNTQFNFLIALSKDIEQLSSQKVLHEHDLGTSGNVTKIKKALINKEIIDISKGKITFNDPVFKLWLQRSFPY